MGEEGRNNSEGVRLEVGGQGRGSKIGGGDRLEWGGVRRSDQGGRWVGVRGGVRLYSRWVGGIVVDTKGFIQIHTANGKAQSLSLSCFLRLTCVCRYTHLPQITEANGSPPSEQFNKSEEESESTRQRSSYRDVK